MARRVALGIALAALAALTGCNAVFGLDSVPHGDDADDGSDAAGDADPDRDHDGWPNAQDDCPDLADPAQHDDDGDAVGDVCDNCPTRGNEGQSDAGDRDGVGDACDPDRTAEPDHILFFDGFGGALDAWIPVSGVWSTLSDHAATTATTPVLLSTLARFTGPLAEITFRWDGVATSGSMGIVTHLDASTPSKPLGYACQAQITPMGGTDLASSQIQIVKRGTTGNTTLAFIAGPPVMLGKTYRLIVDQRNSTIECAFSDDVEFTSVVAVDTEFTTGTIALATEAAVVEVDNAIVFR